MKYTPHCQLIVAWINRLSRYSNDNFSKKKTKSGTRRFLKSAETSVVRVARRISVAWVDISTMESRPRFVVSGRKRFSKIAPLSPLRDGNNFRFEQFGLTRQRFGWTIQVEATRNSPRFTFEYFVQPLPRSCTSLLSLCCRSEETIVGQECFPNYDG